MKVKLSEIESVFKAITLSNVSSINIRNVIDEIFDNYADAEFNLIGDYESVNQSYKYLQFKLKELIHNKLPIAKELFIANAEVLLDGINGSQREIQYVGGESMTSSGNLQNENSPMNNDITEIETPTFKSATVGSNTRQFEGRFDIHSFKSIDEIIKKYDYLNKSNFATLHSFCEKNFVLPLIEEFNTMY